MPLSGKVKWEFVASIIRIDVSPEGDRRHIAPRGRTM
jgi:hypothetical protein